jgi:PTH1 family peptidyl-tRNA hydrolase
VNFFKVEPQNIIVIHDDLDIAFGELKVQADRSSAGHNGVQSIIDRLGTQSFTRLRVGIAKSDKSKQGDAADFVLHRFGLVERLQLKVIKKKVLEEIKKLI